jgi:hypothetical protein
MTQPSKDRRSHHIGRQTAANGGAEECYFGEKDERSVNGVSVIRGLDPRIHPLRKKHLSKTMDCRIKPGNDD